MRSMTDEGVTQVAPFFMSLTRPAPPATLSRKRERETPLLMPPRQDNHFRLHRQMRLVDDQFGIIAPFNLKTLGCQP
jgi:hypothetical protein